MPASTVSGLQHRGTGPTWRLAIACTLLAVLSAGASSSNAKVWTVEKDGSGHFTVIQDAVIGAASGDTIQIGPGRFEETHVVSLPGGDTELHAWIEEADLTLIGAGQDVTFIGPADGPGTQGDPYGIITDTNSGLTVSNLTVENVGRGLLANGPTLHVTNCTFRACDRALDTLSPDGISIQNTRFESCEDGLAVFQGLGAKNGVIQDCVFQDCLGGIVLQTENHLIENCQFDGQYGGISFEFAATGTVRNCTFTNLVGQGLTVGSGSSAVLLDSRFEVADINILVSNGSNLTGSGNVLKGGTFWTISIVPDASVDFRENHILNAGGLTVYAPGNEFSSNQHDLRDNYWGTADAQQIADWIHDGLDTGYQSRVFFEPFYDTPIPNKATSLSELKSLFGQTGGPNPE